MTELKRPTARTCERCGRQERWDEESESWRIAGDSVGELFCIHEWDINGTFNPVAE